VLTNLWWPPVLGLALTFIVAINFALEPTH
jgi:hypothetical protein